MRAHLCDEIKRRPAASIRLIPKIDIGPCLDEEWDQPGQVLVSGTVHDGLAPVVERHVFARWAAHDVSGKHGRNRDIDFFVGPSIVREEEASLPSSWYRCPHDDLPYTDFRGVPGTNLWLKVNDLGLIDFHPMYEREYDGLHEIWLNIYQSMIGLVAPVVLDRVPSFGGWREEHESNAESTDEDEPVRVSRV